MQIRNGRVGGAHSLRRNAHLPPLYRQTAAAMQADQDRCIAAGWTTLSLNRPPRRMSATEDVLSCQSCQLTETARMIVPIILAARCYAPPARLPCASTPPQYCSDRTPRPAPGRSLRLRSTRYAVIPAARPADVFIVEKRHSRFLRLEGPLVMRKQACGLIRASLQRKSIVSVRRF